MSSVNPSRKLGPMVVGVCKQASFWRRGSSREVRSSDTGRTDVSLPAGRCSASDMLTSTVHRLHGCQSFSPETNPFRHIPGMGAASRRLQL
jgi:hypothetical protein